MYTLTRTNTQCCMSKRSKHASALYKYLSDKLLADGYLLYGFHSSFASLSYFCFVFWCQNHFSLKAERWNQSKETPKWSTLFYWTFWSKGLAERNFVKVDENNLLHLCHCSLRESKGSNIHMSFKKIASVRNAKFRVVSLTNSSSTQPQLPCWFF